MAAVALPGQQPWRGAGGADGHALGGRSASGRDEDHVDHPRDQLPSLHQWQFRKQAACFFDRRQLMDAEAGLERDETKDGLADALLPHGEPL